MAKGDEIVHKHKETIMNKMIPVLLALAVLTIAPLTGVAEEMVDMEAAKATFETTCSKCHDLQRPLGALKGKESWEKTVSRMSGYHKRFGGPIPDEDQKAIVEYLLVNAGK
jgi:cytochrome c5